MTNRTSTTGLRALFIVLVVTVIVQVAGLVILWPGGVDAWLWVSVTVNALGAAVCADTGQLPALALTALCEGEPRVSTRPDDHERTRMGESMTRTPAHTRPSFAFLVTVTVFLVMGGSLIAGAVLRGGVYDTTEAFLLIGGIVLVMLAVTMFTADRWTASVWLRESESDEA